MEGESELNREMGGREERWIWRENIERGGCTLYCTVPGKEHSGALRADSGRERDQLGGDVHDPNQYIQEGGVF